MKKINLISMAVASICTVAFVSSCTKEDDINKLDGKYVYFSVNAENGTETKVSSTIQETENFEISDNGTSLYITASKSVNNDNPFVKKSATKGSEKTIDDVSEGFSMYMFADADGSLYKNGVVKQQSSDGSYWSFYDSSNEKIVWPDEAESGATYSFVSCIAAANMTVSNYAAHTVDYKGMTHASGNINDAKNMEDLLVAYTAGVKHDHNVQNLVNLRFYHPLAAVKFYVSPKVRRITISNVRKAGTVTYKAVDPNDEDDFKNAFIWESSSDESNITSYTQDVFSSDQGKVKEGYAVYEFFLIPQKFVSQDVMLTFDVQDSKGNVHEISTLANNLGTESWDAGYRYNYYIDEEATANVGLQIDEHFENDVKTNVSVHNIKRSTAYIRATVIANWESESGKIISDYKGTINYNVGGDSKWVKGDDGYYYYKDPVVGFTYTDPLITSFSDSSTSSELNFQLRKYRLVWRIVAQGVEYDTEKKYVKAAWSDITVNSQNLVNTVLTPVMTAE